MTLNLIDIQNPPASPIEEARSRCRQAALDLMVLAIGAEDRRALGEAQILIAVLNLGPR